MVHTVVMPNEDWDRLADAVARRMEELGLTQGQVQQRGGPSPAKVREITSRRATALSPSKRRDLERALDWTYISVDDVLAGGDPTVVPPGTPDDRPAPVHDGLRAAIRSAIGELRTVSDIAFSRQEYGVLTTSTEATARLAELLTQLGDEDDRTEDSHSAAAAGASGQASEVEEVSGAGEGDDDGAALDAALADAAKDEQDGAGLGGSPGATGSGR